VSAAGALSVAAVGLFLAEVVGPRLVTRAVAWWALHGAVAVSSWGL